MPTIWAFPLRKQTTGPPIPDWVGAGFALAPRKLKRPVQRLRIDASPWWWRWLLESLVLHCSSLGSQPGYKQWLSNHTEWSPVNSPGSPVPDVAYAAQGGTTDRPVRTASHRPPAVDHRPLQFPLHLLHAPGGHAVARPP